MKKLYHGAILTLMLGMPALVNAQSLDDVEDPYALSLEELMNIPINSASKKDETLFDAPLSSYTITRAAILQAGSTSIMEALRLAPGLIVREQSNGNYDIHIRGFDNILRTAGAVQKGNLATLVMIDNRPVFNHNLGGTAWETLPIDINDVERIEIVRGPSAPLFGPNAVSGVINIITKKVTKSKHAYATAQYGTEGAMIGQVSVGGQITEKLDISASANFHERQRFQDEYFNPATNSYEDFSSDEFQRGRYPHMDRAIQKFGANTFIRYNPNKNIDLDLTLGLQRSDAQKVLLAPTGQWDRAAIDAAIATGENQQTQLAAPVPVYIAYFTAAATSDGNIIAYDDIYGRDVPVRQALNRVGAANTAVASVD